MAYSTQRAVSTGSMAYLDLSILYMSRGDISVYYNGFPAGAGTWAWVGVTDKRITFSPAIANGVEVLIKRTTRIDRQINVFASGAKFNNATMDINFTQVIYLNQEAVEGGQLTDVFNDLNMHGFKVTQLGTATLASDAVPLGQLQTMSQGAYQAQIAAEAARDKARQWASQPTASVDGTYYSAYQYALNASISAAAALGSQNAAKLSETNSKTSETNSKASENAAKTSATTAHDEQVTGKGWLDQTTAIAVDVQTIRDNAANALSVANGVDGKASQALNNSTAAVTTANAADTKAASAITKADASTAASNAAVATIGGKLNKAGDTMTGDLYIRATAAASPWIHMYADGYIGTHIRAANSGMEWYDSGIANRNMLIDNAGNLSVRSAGTFGGRVQANDMVSLGIVYSGGGNGQLAPDGNIYGGAWGGYLSNFLNSQFAGKTNARNNSWANQGFVVTNSANNMQIWWDGRVQVQVDGSYQGYMWTSGNFNPGTKADAGAQVQISAYADFGGVDAVNLGQRAQVPAPYVMVGLIVTAKRGPSADCLGACNLIGGWLRNQ